MSHEFLVLINKVQDLQSWFSIFDTYLAEARACINDAVKVF